MYYKVTPLNGSKIVFLSDLLIDDFSDWLSNVLRTFEGYTLLKFQEIKYEEYYNLTGQGVEFYDSLQDISEWGFLEEECIDLVCKYLTQDIYTDMNKSLDGQDHSFSYLPETLDEFLKYRMIKNIIT